MGSGTSACLKAIWVPHREQNDRVPFSVELNCAGIPLTTRNSVNLTLNHVTNGAPVVRRQIEQWPRPVSVAAGSQRHERAGWYGPAPLPPLLAAGSNALAPYGRGKGRDTPRHRAALTPAASGLAIAVALAVAGLSLQWRAGASLLKGQRDGFALDSPLEEAGLKLLVPLRGLVPIALSKTIGKPCASRLGTSTGRLFRRWEIRLIQRFKARSRDA